MKRDSLLSAYDRLTGVVEKLPGGLQKPILRELMPIRQLFLEHRPARLMLVGEEGIPARDFLAELGAGDFTYGDLDNGWRRYLAAEQSEICILDARRPASGEAVAAGIARKKPDIVIIVGGEKSTDADWKSFIARAALVDVPVIGIARASALGELMRLKGEPSLAGRVRKVLEAGDPAGAEAICAALPLPAQLDFARATGARRAQAHIAGSLLKSFSAVCGVIGVQPIPLADMPILTGLQTLMVALIIHTTGRPFSTRLAAEFFGALGINIGAAFLLREGARALVKMIPIWGNAISGVIAAAGTYAIGKAAIAYFIDKTPLAETRRIFYSLLPRRSRARNDFAR